MYKMEQEHSVFNSLFLLFTEFYKNLLYLSQNKLRFIFITIIILHVLNDEKITISVNAFSIYLYMEFSITHI